MTDNKLVLCLTLADLCMFPGDQFTLKEIGENQFYYVHDGSESLTDVIRLTVEDGTHSVPLNISVDIIKVDSSSPSRSPRASMTLVVAEGKMHSSSSRLIVIDSKKVCNNC